MSIYCDTSFLFSLYGTDVHTPKAIDEIAQLERPITLSSFAEYELANAFRFAECRKFLATGKAAACLAAFEMDILIGKIVIETCNLAEIIEQAKRLSATHTLSGGYRAFDVLHVATALYLKTNLFLTFDKNQKKLAQLEGLKVR